MAMTVLIRSLLVSLLSASVGNLGAQTAAEFLSSPPAPDVAPFQPVAGPYRGAVSPLSGTAPIPSFIQFLVTSSQNQAFISATSIKLSIPFDNSDLSGTCGAYGALNSTTTPAADLLVSGTGSALTFQAMWASSPGDPSGTYTHPSVWTLTGSFTSPTSAAGTVTLQTFADSRFIRASDGAVFCVCPCLTRLYSATWTAQSVAIDSFLVSPPSIRAGQSATLTWSTRGVTSVTIDNGVGPVVASGSKVVTPSTTTTYRLTAGTGSASVTSTVTVEVLTGPIVNVTVLPTAMVQLAGSGGAITTYALANSGSTPTTITLTQDGSFFAQSPSSFTLAPGGTQVVTITATAQPAGSYEGASLPSGSGLPSGLQIPVKLLSAVPPAGTVTAQAPVPRVDVAAPPASSPTGSVSFTNGGSAALTGILTSDVPWLIPQSGAVSIAPGATRTFGFTTDRSKRPDSATPTGSVEGNLLLSFFTGSSSSFAKRPLDTPTATPSVSIVKVVDTAQPSVTTAGIPTIGAGEIALFVAGVGHRTGIGGPLFVSDVSVLNAKGNKPIDDLKMYYTPTTGSASSAKTASLPSIPGQVSVAVADVVKNVFSGDEELGTLQIRSKDADKLAVAATVLTANNPSGTFGNAIPVFRSDRGVETGSALFLTGLRKDTTTHTNIYVQETAGSRAAIQTDFLTADGLTVSSRTDSIDPFKLLQLVNVVPANAVAAVITNTSTEGGKIAAYATPVDEASSDTWAIADWSSQLGYAPADPVIIPVAGSVHGANNTFYRTDVAVTNRTASAASGALRYVSRSGEMTDTQISLGAKQSEIMSDVIGSRLKIAGDSTGFLIFTPVTGSFAVSSRTFTTVGGKADTFGTGVPTLAVASALKVGGSRPIAGLSDATRAAVVAQRPGTFRTNFALLETSGQAVTVRVTFRFTFPAGQKVLGIGSASRDYDLNGNAFLLLNSIAGEILGPARLQFGDLTNVEADFQIVSGNGAVFLFTSSVDNGTADSILRTE